MPLAWNEIRARAFSFAEDWRERAFTAREEADAQTFLTEFFHIFGVSRKQVAVFEKRVPIGGTPDLFGGLSGGRKGYIDLFWKGRILIEMKSPGKDLKEAYKQAQGYALSLSKEDMPEGILVCDFQTFLYYDLAKNLEKNAEPAAFSLRELPERVELFACLAGYRSVEYKAVSPVDIEAAERMGALHDALKDAGYSGHALEMYLVRLLFCLFADDTGIFEEKKRFHQYIAERTGEDGADLAMHLEALFETLNKPRDQRLKTIDEQLNGFPYVDGSLFEERLETAAFNAKMRRSLLHCCLLDWSLINPEIFGALFQSIKDKESRRALGEHYTSETNILKLIKPLFLDALRAELETIKRRSAAKKKHALLQFHDKLSRLTFLDPACGCGNFLVVAYRELRQLEIETLKALLGLEQIFDIELMVRVNVNQFYGIEIEEFPARIAQTALWLMDHLMNIKASQAFGTYVARIPLTVSPKIIIGNALTINWETVVPKTELSYILGNPPFLGARLMSPEQKTEVACVFEGLKNCANLDYVTCWYKKAAVYMKDTGIEAAFVSTNSICQGEQVPILWPELMNRHGITINFAHQTFKWRNQARGMAAVYCVIVGFSPFDRQRKEKTLYHYAAVTADPVETPAHQINAYLLDGPLVFIQKRSTPLCDVSEMVFGSMPNDNGHFLLTEEEKESLVSSDKTIADLIRPFMGADEFINNIPKFCIWLKDAPPSKYRKSKLIRERIAGVKRARETSKRASTRDLAAFPTLFGEIRQPETDYLLVPRVSSEKRPYIPIGFLPKEVIAGDTCLVIPNATLYEFGILNSSMHMAWVRYVCGRLELRYRYSASIVYNTFPWPDPTAKQKAAIEKAAQGVLDARAVFPEESLAALYDPDTMPAKLVKAHQKLDKAVEAPYGKSFTNDADRAAHLFFLYQTLTEGLMAKKTRLKNL